MRFLFRGTGSRSVNVGVRQLQAHASCPGSVGTITLAPLQMDASQHLIPSTASGAGDAPKGVQEPLNLPEAKQAEF